MSFFSLPAPHRFLRARSAFALILATLVLTGCQEDTRASKMDTQRASQVADSRLKQAQSNLLATLGKPAAADEPYRQSADAGQEPATQLTPRTLVWTPPLTREDGSSLAPGQISEYRIYYRLKHKESYDVIALKDAGTTRFVLESMPPGAYEFSITTVDVEGLESRRSDPVQINLI